MWSWAALDRNPHLPGARGAVASGDLLSQDGEYFGPVVGLAARAVALAAPGRVVVPEPTRAELGDGWTCRALGAHASRASTNPSCSSRWREPDSGDAEGQRSFSPRALLNRSATSGQFTMFQNASTQSAFTFRYCR